MSKTFLFLTLLTFACTGGNKQSSNLLSTEDHIEIAVDKTEPKVEENELIEVTKDSLNYLFDRVFFYKRNYAHRLNVSENFPKLLQISSKLKPREAFKELEQLITLFNTSKDYRTPLTDSLCNLIIGKIYSERELYEIRDLYNTSYAIDTNLTNDQNLNNIVSRYHRIDHYFKGQYYFRDSLIRKFWELCPEYYRIKSIISENSSDEIDSIKQDLLTINSDHEENNSFVASLISKDLSDSLLPSYSKPIAPIFEPINGYFGIYGMNLKRYGDQTLLNSSSIPTILKQNSFEEKLFQDSLPTNDSTTIFAYSNNGRSVVNISQIGYVRNECIDSYYFYELDSASEHGDKLLLSSPYQLELDFKNYPHIDSLISSNNTSICLDCPEGWADLKTFAKLKGFENIYFTATANINGEFDETDTYLRAIYYIKGDFIFTLWWEEYDAFGCACL